VDNLLLEQYSQFYDDDVVMDREAIIFHIEKDIFMQFISKETIEEVDKKVKAKRRQ